MRPFGKRLSNRPCTATPPNVTVAPRPAPLIVTSVAPSVDPRLGESDVTEAVPKVVVPGVTDVGVVGVGAVGVDDEPQADIPCARTRREIPRVTLIRSSAYCFLAYQALDSQDDSPPQWHK